LFFHSLNYFHFLNSGSGKDNRHKHENDEKNVFFYSKSCLYLQPEISKSFKKKERGTLTLFLPLGFRQPDQINKFSPRIQRERSLTYPCLICECRNLEIQE
jgi:hypothetical protein